MVSPPANVYEDESQQMKEGVFSKGALAEIACNVVFPLLACAQRLHEISARRWLVQNFGWSDNGPQGAKNPELQNRNEESAVQRGVCNSLCTSGVRRKLAAKFPTFSTSFVLQCLTFRMQELRFPTISELCRIFFCEVPHCGGPFEGWRGAGLWNLVWCSRGAGLWNLVWCSRGAGLWNLVWCSRYRFRRHA